MDAIGKIVISSEIILFAVFLAIIALLLAFAVSWKLYRGLTLKGWGSVLGTITSSEVLHDGDGYKSPLEFETLNAA